MYKVEVIELNGRGDKVAKAILLEDRDLKTKKDAVAEIVSYVRLHCDRLCRNEYFTYLDVSGWDEVAKKTKKYKGVIEGSTGDVYISRVCKGLDKYFQIAKLEIDKALLRLGLYEVKYFEETPGRVAVNEIIEIAKKYSDETSAKFVNGLLSQFVTE